MARSKARFAIAEATRRQLWARASWCVHACRWESQYSVHQQQAILEELNRILLELQLREDPPQLQLNVSPPGPAA